MRALTWHPLTQYVTPANLAHTLHLKTPLPAYSALPVITRLDLDKRHVPSASKALSAQGVVLVVVLIAQLGNMPLHQELLSVICVCLELTHRHKQHQTVQHVQ